MKLKTVEDLLENQNLKYSIKDNKEMEIVTYTTKIKSPELNKYKLGFFVDYDLKYLRILLISLDPIQISKKNKLKTLLLDKNFDAIYGSFAIRKGKNDIVLSHTHSLETDMSDAISIEQLADYVDYMIDAFDELIEEVEDNGF